MTHNDLEKLVLRHVNRPSYRPAKPRVIARQMRLPKEQHADLKHTIKKLVRTGHLSFGPKHLVHGAKQRPRDEVVGTFRRHAAGYGFVRPEGVDRTQGRDQDIFIPARKTRDAASGDVVRVRARERTSAEGGRRMSGEILQILKRGTTQFVGTYFEEHEKAYVQIDGTEFPLPVLVGDPGAKNARPGDKVVIEMIRYPSAHRPGEGVIVEVLGPRGRPGVDTLTVIREFDLPEEFPEGVLENARRQADLFEQAEEAVPDDRVDLTALTIITIDPADARDFDDAISLEVLENGHLRLGVHIADVSHFVRPKTPLDREARDRATSIYLPDRVIPMLPEVISNHLASLQPDRVRYAKTAFIEYTPEGIRVGLELASSAIRSKRRFAYEEVDQFLVNREVWKDQLTPEVFQLLERMHTLAMTLRRRRFEQGALEMDLPEIKIVLDENGQVIGARRVVHTESHQVIEEFMLAANQAVAERLKETHLPFLRRVHEPPDPRKLQQLTEFVRELGIECESLESRFEIQRVLRLVRGTPLEYAVNYAVLRAMQKAVYSPRDLGHYALAMRDYCHFTSPIRRYPDLTIHRLIESLLKDKPHGPSLEDLVLLGDHCSEREQRAESAERELIKLKLLHFMEAKIGETFDVIVTGVEDFGLFGQGIDLPAEGFIPLEELPDDRYEYDRTTHTLTGRRHGNTFRLGDALQTRIVHVDLDRREMDLAFVSKLDHRTLLARRSMATSLPSMGSTQSEEPSPAGKPVPTPGVATDDHPVSDRRRTRARKTTPRKTGSHKTSKRGGGQRATRSRKGERKAQGGGTSSAGLGKRPAAQPATEKKPAAKSTTKRATTSRKKGSKQATTKLATKRPAKKQSLPKKTSTKQTIAKKTTKKQPAAKRTTTKQTKKKQPDKGAADAKRRPTDATTRKTVTVKKKTGKRTTTKQTKPRSTSAADNSSGRKKNSGQRGRRGSGRRGSR